MGLFYSARRREGGCGVMPKSSMGRYAAVYDAAPDAAKSLAYELIKNALFMERELKKLQTSIRKNGVVTEYKNGENQWGTKKSPEVEVYNSMIKNYTAVVSKLNDILPESDTAPDDLVAFLGGGKL